MSRLVIVDYGMGNLHSVYKAFRRIGADPLVTSDPGPVATAERLVLPGVGHFGRAMDNLAARGLREALDTAALRRQAPVLGICLGMQLFAQRSQEGEAAGLGWLDAQVVRLQLQERIHHKVPHMGWNTVVQRKESRLASGLPPEASFYFVHSYHVVCADPGDVLFETDYAGRFVSAVERGNVVGVQFHPEKSHASGQRLLRGFLEL